MPTTAVAEEPGVRQRDLILLLAVVALFLTSRLWHLGSWVFLLNDEAIELHRALLIHSDPTNLWLPNVEYKPPLFYWIASLMAAVFGNTTLVVRLISVASSLLVLLAVFFFVGRVINTRIAFVAGLLYVLTPLGALFDRTGFMETFVGLLTFGAFVVFVEGHGDRRPDVRACFVGLLLGLAFFTKQTTLLFLPFFVVWTVLSRRARKPAWVRLTMIISIVLAFMTLFTIAPDVPSMWNNDASEGTTAMLYHGSYRLTLSQIAQFPAATWWGNAVSITGILVEHLTIPILVLALLGGLISVVTWTRKILAALLYAGIPLFVMVIVASGTSIHSYMFQFLVAPVSILAAFSVSEIGRWLRVRLGSTRARWAVALVVVGVSLAALTKDIPLFLRPLDALATMKKGVLVPAAMSEYRVRDGAEELIKIAEEEPIYVLTDISFGMPNDGLAVHLWNRQEVVMVYCWWINQEAVPLVPQEAIEVHESNHHRTTGMVTMGRGQLRSRPVYWIVNSVRYPPVFVRERAPQSKQVFSLPSPDGASLDAYLVWLPAR